MQKHNLSRTCAENLSDLLFSARVYYILLLWDLLQACKSVAFGFSFKAAFLMPKEE